MLLLAGCDGFLKEYSQSDIRPGSVADLQEMMMGEAYPSKYNDPNYHFGRYLELLTDDVTQINMPAMASSIEAVRVEAERYSAKGMGPFTWSVDMYEMMDEQTAGTNTWEILYSLIKGCNVALDNVNTVPGTVAEKADLVGQALALRSFYYWYLVNCYALPANAEGAMESPGVPLVLKSAVEDLMPARNTVGEVYARIEADLMEALPLLEAHGQTVSKHRVTLEFAWMMLCRVCLYQERWAEAAQWAGKIIDKRPELLNMASGSHARCDVLESASPESIWLYSDGIEWRDASFLGSGTAYNPSESLRSMYAAGDLRVTSMGGFWGMLASDFVTINYIRKCSNSFPRAGGKGMRTAEAYLNRAEALIEQVLAGGDAGLLTQALDELNTLRQNRLSAAAYAPLSITDPAEALQFCRDERRRELCWEEHRWFDLRRWGMPEITHSYQPYIEGSPTDYVLAAGDKRYVLQIPKETIDRNVNLTQNPR